MTVHEIHQVADRYAAFAAQIPRDPQAARSKNQDDLLAPQRALYYCEATLINDRTNSPEARRDLASRVAPGDAHLLVWLGLSEGPG